MKNNRGFAAIWIMAGVLVLIAIAAGVCIFVRSTNQATTSQNTNSPVPVASNSSADNERPSLAVLMNAKYELEYDNSLHQFKSGRYDFSFLQGKTGAATGTNGYAEVDTDHITYAQFNNDIWKNVAFVIVRENDGGSGTFHILEMMLGKDAQFATYFNLGDRVDVHSVSVVQNPLVPDDSSYKAITVDMTPWEGTRRTIYLVLKEDGAMHEINVQ